MTLCAICNENEVEGIFRVCNDCVNTLKTLPKIHLRLAKSSTERSGVVLWEHNAIGAAPYDNNPEAVGIWGVYGSPPDKLEFWVSLCKPIEAIHDMMTQLYLKIDADTKAFMAEYPRRTNTDGINTPLRSRQVRKIPEPVVDDTATSSYFADMKARLSKTKG